MSAGSAVQDLLFPHRIIIGNPDTASRLDPSTLSLLRLYSPWIPNDKIRVMSNTSAELVKIANNAFEAQRISSINSLSSICEQIGAQITDVSCALGMNPNIGPRFLQAGVGFGGSCLRKDTLGLSGLAMRLSLPEVAQYWRHVIAINDFQIHRFTTKVCRYGSKSSSRAVAILGYAFKKDTDDTRGSIAKDVILELLCQNMTVAVHDPLIPASIMERLLPETPQIRICSTPYEACSGVEIVAILNDSDEYKSLNWEDIIVNMKGDQKAVIDGRGLGADKQLEALNVIVERMGKPLEPRIVAV